MLDRFDEALEVAIQREPSMLLIRPAQLSLLPSPTLPEVASGASVIPATTPGIGDGKLSSPASSLRDTEKLVLACLQFLGVVMRNCLNKQIFSSSEVR